MGRHEQSWKELLVLLVAFTSLASPTKRYQASASRGPCIHSDVAEVFAVRDGTIRSLDICFDSASFPK